LVLSFESLISPELAQRVAASEPVTMDTAPVLGSLQVQFLYLVWDPPTQVDQLPKLPQVQQSPALQGVVSVVD